MVANERGKKLTSKKAFQGLQVYHTLWQTIGPVHDFPIDEPRLLLVGEKGTKKTRQHPIYVLRSRKGFRVFDMERGGEYESEVWRGQVMIRRRFPDDRRTTVRHLQVLSN
ncbi:hypothetical protein SY88_04580 [Clostridiales bacterium PH28_bin88]|nr:hypothetical protein SY88_04580 [Clostridiales bacterium PH28_bin88]